MRSTKTILSSVLLLAAAGCGSRPEPFQYAAAVKLGPATRVAPAAAPVRPAALPDATVLPAPKLLPEPVVVAREAAALSLLERRVPRRSHPAALRIAFQAYWNFRRAHPEQVRKPYLYFVDYGLDSREPRGYLFDMDRLELVEGPFPVAHGRGSASGAHGVPTRFSNLQNSNSTSLGLYVAEETYAFRGTSGGRRYQSIGLRLRGVSGKFNSAARRRGIVVHGAPYVTATKAGRSEGCPAMEPDRAERIIPMIANGGVVFHFSPRDASWMRDDPWITAAGSQLANAAATVSTGG